MLARKITHVFPAEQPVDPAQTLREASRAHFNALLEDAIGLPDSVLISALGEATTPAERELIVTQLEANAKTRCQQRSADK